MSLSNEIIPAILAKDTSDLREKISELPSEIKFVHIDVLEDDCWETIGLDFEAHLMVREPEKIVDQWVKRGAKRIITHKDLDLIQGIEFGRAFKLDEEIKDLGNANFVHLMSIDEIGEQGHPFNPQVFDRIKRVREKFPEVPISVDGGISIENYQKLIESGANRLIVGSHFKELWNSLTKK